MEFIEGFSNCNLFFEKDVLELGHFGCDYKDVYISIFKSTCIGTQEKSVTW